MNDTVVQVKSLGKLYRIGKRQQYKTLREALTSSFVTTLRNIRKGLKDTTSNYIWALKDVSFEVKKGDVIGIIGRNGAGKTTLLKILSRITLPSEGYAHVQGRIGSLLEVGAGFHPELTGRDNIYLNGAILGMKKKEIDRKFDEIVAFAELDKFIDTPIKYYSSGMYVRLAFAVAAHFESEILLVDEVLAVGDAAFQKKCLGKMEDVAKGGRTVLFVSHNMGMITQLCTQAIYLKSGKNIFMGEVNSVVLKYTEDESILSSHRQLVQNEEETRKSKQVFFKKISVTNDKGIETAEIDVRYHFYLNLEYEVTMPLKNVEITVRIDTSDGRPLFSTNQSDCSLDCLNVRKVGHHRVSIKLPEMFLMPGIYLVTIGAHEPMVQFYDVHDHVLSFRVIDTGTKFARYQRYQYIGAIMIDLPWSEC